MQTKPTAAPLVTSGSWRIDMLVTGFPGKSVCHGALGWSTIALLRGYGRVALIDTGGYGVRGVLLERLAEFGLTPEAVTDVILTHAHFDHIVNWTMFPRASVFIGGGELEWAVGEPWGRTPVPELHVEALNRHERTRRLSPGDEVLPGVITHHAPGHTPGHLIFVLEDDDWHVIFTSDAAKNQAEFLSGEVDMSLSVEDSRATIHKIREMALARPGTIIVPGHDRPLIEEDGAFAYIGERNATIISWRGETLDETTAISLEP